MSTAEMMVNLIRLGCCEDSREWAAEQPDAESAWRDCPWFWLQFLVWKLAKDSGDDELRRRWCAAVDWHHASVLTDALLAWDNMGRESADHLRGLITLDEFAGKMAAHLERTET